MRLIADIIPSEGSARLSATSVYFRVLPSASDRLQTTATPLHANLAANFRHDFNQLPSTSVNFRQLPSCGSAMSTSSSQAPPATTIHYPSSNNTWIRQQETRFPRALIAVLFRRALRILGFSTARAGVLDAFLFSISLGSSTHFLSFSIHCSTFNSSSLCYPKPI